MIWGGTFARRDNHILMNSFKLLSELEDWQLLAGPVRINYQGEDGIDAGGLAKDWFVEMMKSLLRVSSDGGSSGSGGSGFDDDQPEVVSFSILHETEQGVTINPTAGIVYSEDECQYMYRTFGVFLAKALIGKVQCNAMGACMCFATAG